MTDMTIVHARKAIPLSQADSAVPENAQLKRVTTAEEVLGIIGFLKEHGVDVWLHGGWALEALTGIARVHTDIDIITDERHRDRLRNLLAGRIVKDRMHKLQVNFDGAEVDLVFFSKERGRLITWHPKLIAVWPPDLLTHGKTARLSGRDVPIISPTALFIQISHRVGKTRELKEKNERDRGLFHDIISDEQKKMAAKFFPREVTLVNRLRTALGF